MQTSLNHIGLLLLPMLALASWFIQEPPMLAVNIYPDENIHLGTNDFYDVEKMLSKLYVIKENQLLIDSQTEKYLSQVESYMDRNRDEALLERTFPTAQGKRLLGLVNCYKAYKKTERQISQHYAAVQHDQLIDYRNLQTKFFGKTANDLFSDHHRFYESVTGVQLVSPVLNDIKVAAACEGVRDLE